MKKTLLTLGAALLLSAGVFAQTSEADATNSDVSKNAPTATKKGYAFEWAIGGSEAGDADVYNCMSAANPFSTAGYTFSLEKTEGYLVVNTDGKQSATSAASIRLQEANCANATVDLSSDAKTQTITFKARANADTKFAILAAFESGGQFVLADLSYPKVDLTKDTWSTHTVAIPAKGWLGSANVDNDYKKIIGVAFQATGTVKVEVDYVVLGDAPAPTDVALTDAEIAALDVKVFPNPASDVVNVSYNVPADEQVTVTLLNSLGQAVASVEGSTSSASIDVAGLNGGLYFASVVVDGIVVATQKVIVE